MKLPNFLAWVSLCLVFIPISSQALAAGTAGGEFAEQITPHGHMNWTTGMATATGLGIPPRNATSAMQSREMTRAAAWSVALRNLLEVIKGIQVDSQTTVQNYVTTDATVQTRVEGIIQGAKLLQERELPTGEFETTVQIKIAGQISESVLPKGPQLSPPLEQRPKILSYAKPKVPYTGLVIDARGTGAKPALAPRIVTQDVKIYCEQHVDSKLISDPSVEEPGRIAWYSSDETAANAHYKVSPNPLTIKATRAVGKHKTDLLIEEAKAEYIEALPEHRAFLTNAKVLIIVDPN